MRSPSGASAELLRRARAGHVTLLVSVSLALEYEATCKRPEHRLAAGLNEASTEVYLDALIALGEPVTSHYLWRPQLRDPGDEMVLEVAVNGQADQIVTFNKRHFLDAPGRFGIEVVLPREALTRMPR